MSKTERKPLEHNAIRYARERLDYKEADWLRRKGWQSTSSTPGCYWMWQKEWGGKTFLVNQDTAARIQGHWDAEEDYKQHPEDYED